jgi:hypothetical protein
MDSETMDPGIGQAADRCSGCGLVVEGGTGGCQKIADEMWGREFGDVTYFRVHRMTVDTYCLQHPDRY